jgi:hypothetical protein
MTFNKYVDYIHGYAVSNWEEKARYNRELEEQIEDLWKGYGVLYSKIKPEIEVKRKENRMVYYVKFDGTDKLYAYYCAKNLHLQIGSKYTITADGVTEYKNPITVIKTSEIAPTNVGNIRTITSATMIGGAPRPDDRIKQVIFNKEKLTTVVLWADGQKTIIKCQEGDVFDEEKALALCYMKRVLGNRGSFNETLRKYCHQEETN